MLEVRRGECGPFAGVACTASAKFRTVAQASVPAVSGGAGTMASAALAALSLEFGPMEAWRPGGATAIVAACTPRSSGPPG